MFSLKNKNIKNALQLWSVVSAQLLNLAGPAHSCHLLHLVLLCVTPLTN